MDRAFLRPRCVTCEAASSDWLARTPHAVGACGGRVMVNERKWLKGTCEKIGFNESGWVVVVGEFCWYLRCWCVRVQKDDDRTAEFLVSCFLCDVWLLFNVFLLVTSRVIHHGPGSSTVDGWNKLSFRFLLLKKSLHELTYFSIAYNSSCHSLNNIVGRSTVRHGWLKFLIVFH
jgi:hypothetical protein